MGTPDFAVPTLDAVVAAGHDVVAVYSQPPRPAGRGKALRPSPVQARAEALGIEVRTPRTLRDSEVQEAFATLGLDVGVVAAYGLILPIEILEAPHYGCLNVHGSLLPRWRGAAPVQRAILAGDVMTGISIMAMERGLDTGPVFAVRETPIDAKTAGELTAELAATGAGMMVEVLGELEALTPIPQPEEGVTYAAKIEKHEAKLDFTQTASAVERQIRAFNPVPGAFFEFAGERVKVLGAEMVDCEGIPATVLDQVLTIACEDRSIRLLLVQRSGRGVMTSAELLRGFALSPGGSARVTRFRLTIEYDGRPFMGWQRQPHGPSVQQAIEEAVLAITGEQAVVHGAGRTDAGVHALAMEGHFDIAKAIAPSRIADGLNAKLRSLPVAILAAREVAGDWHARFSCTGRRYIYRIVNRRAPLALEAGRAWRVPVSLDAKAMDEAAQALVGRHDFTTFRSARCQSASPAKTLERLDVRRQGDEIVIEAAARSFLHHQVRSMVGCLQLVGRGKWSGAELREALEARDRAALGLNAPPDGLYFAAALYAEAAPSPNSR